MEYKGNNVVGALMNIPIFIGTFSILTDFAVLEDMDAYHDEVMGDLIFGEPFLIEVKINAKRFEGMITIHSGNEDVTYQMARSHLKFKHHTNEQCNKIQPLLKLQSLGASVSVMPLSTYLNLELGELADTKLIVELADRTMKYLKGIVENVLVGSAIISATSSSEYSSWSENRSKSGDLDSSRLSVLKCFLDDQNSHFESLKGVNSSLVELLVMHYLKQEINNQWNELRRKKTQIYEN
nr:hypothetical protein [Tanacetum cinerariifolium]